MRLERGELYLYQTTEPYPFDEERIEHYTIINNPHEFIGKILEFLSMEEKRQIYKRIRELEKKVL